MTTTSEQVKYEYDDKGILCIYMEEKGWIPLEDHCVNCGVKPDECECDEKEEFVVKKRCEFMREEFEGDELKAVRKIIYRELEEDILDIQQVKNKYVVWYKEGDEIETETYRVEIPDSDLIEGVMKEYLAYINPAILSKYMTLSAYAIGILQREMYFQERIDEFYPLIEDWDLFVECERGNNKVRELLEEHYLDEGHSTVWYGWKNHYGLLDDIYVVSDDLDPEDKTEGNAFKKN
jgi:hypothetical protein